MVHTVAISPYQRAEYNFAIDQLSLGNFIWIGFVSKNGIPVSFQIMDRENNLVLYSAERRLEFMARLNVARTERIKFIWVNSDNSEVGR